MADRNFKVVAVLRDDLTPAQRLTAERQLCALQRKFQIEKIDDETYCKGGPVTDNDDFGPVTFFYCKLKRMSTPSLCLLPLPMMMSIYLPL